MAGSLITLVLMTTQPDCRCRLRFIVEMDMLHHLTRESAASAGVYVGCSYQDYTDVVVAVSAKLPPQAVVGAGASFMVGRLSYTFGLTGPCVSTDTACSSSLVATHLAHSVRTVASH